MRQEVPQGVPSCQTCLQTREETLLKGHLQVQGVLRQEVPQGLLSQLVQAQEENRQVLQKAQKALQKVPQGHLQVQGRLPQTVPQRHQDGCGVKERQTGSQLRTKMRQEFLPQVKMRRQMPEGLHVAQVQDGEILQESLSQRSFLLPRSLRHPLSNRVRSQNLPSQVEKDKKDVHLCHLLENALQARIQASLQTQASRQTERTQTGANLHEKICQALPTSQRRFLRPLPPPMPLRFPPPPTQNPTRQNRRLPARTPTSTLSTTTLLCGSRVSRVPQQESGTKWQETVQQDCVQDCVRTESVSSQDLQTRHQVRQELPNRFCRPFGSSHKTVQPFGLSLPESSPWQPMPAVVSGWHSRQILQPSIRCQASENRSLSRQPVSQSSLLRRSEMPHARQICRMRQRLKILRRRQEEPESLPRRSRQLRWQVQTQVSQTLSSAQLKSWQETR